jgi:ADP-heptose:LPS heptosyltransferase
MRVIALVSGGISDQILFFPTIDDLKRYYPNAQIDVVTEPSSKAVYRLSKSVNETLAFDFQDRNSLADWGNLVGTIRDREYDVAITQYQSWSIGLLLWLTGIPNRVGFKGKGSGFLTSSIPQNSQQYAACMYHDLLKGLGIKSPCPELAVSVPKADIDWSINEQKRLGVKDTGYILIHNGSSQLSKIKQLDSIYPIKNWQHIVQGFQAKQPNMPIVVVKGLDDDNFVSTIQESAPNIIKTTSPDNIGKLAAMIAGADLMLCTDSAPMQLSVAVQTYTIALFGSTEPAQLLPKNEKFLAIKSPTGKIGDITAQAVLEKIG